MPLVRARRNERGSPIITSKRTTPSGPATKGPKSSPWSSAMCVPGPHSTPPQVIEPSRTNTTWSLLWPWAAPSSRDPSGRGATGTRPLCRASARRPMRCGPGRARAAAVALPPRHVIGVDDAGARPPGGLTSVRPQRLRSIPSPDHAARGLSTRSDAGDGVVGAGTGSSTRRSRQAAGRLMAAERLAAGAVRVIPCWPGRRARGRTPPARGRVRTTRWRRRTAPAPSAGGAGRG